MAERAQDLPVVSQEGPSPGKDHQAEGPNGQPDSGCYTASLDHTSSDWGQTSKEETDKGATGGAELCGRGRAKERQGCVELSGSGGEDVTTEQPREDEDNSRSFPVIGPRILDNEHVTSDPGKTATTQNGEPAGEEDIKKPQQESQPPLSCSSTSCAVPDLDLPGVEAGLILNSRRIALLSILRSLEKVVCQTRNDLVHQPAEVNPTALHEMLLDTRLEISQASESLLMATAATHTPETPATNTSNVRKGVPHSKNPAEAHTNLPVSSSLHQNLQVGGDVSLEDPVQSQQCSPNIQQVETTDELQQGQPNSPTRDKDLSNCSTQAESQLEDEGRKELLSSNQDKEEQSEDSTCMSVRATPNSTEDSMQVGTTSNSTEDLEHVGTTPNNTEDSEHVGTTSNSTEDLAKKEPPKKTSENEIVPNQVNDGQQNDQNKTGVVSNSAGNKEQSKKAIENVSSKTVLTSDTLAKAVHFDKPDENGTLRNQSGKTGKSTSKDPPKDTMASKTQLKIQEPAKSGVLHDNPVKEGKDKAGVPSNNLERKSCSKPTNKNHCHDAGQEKGRKKESGFTKKRDHGKKVTATPNNKQLAPHQAVDEDQDDITDLKKVWKQNILPGVQDDATAEKETLIKAKFDEQKMHEEKGSQPVCPQKQELIRVSKQRDQKQKMSTSRKKGFIVQIRGDASPGHGYQENPSNTKTPKRASIQTWMSQKISFLIALVVGLYNFFTSWTHKEQPPDVKSCMVHVHTDTAGIALDHDVQVHVYQMQAEDQDTPPDSADHGDDQADDYNIPEWLVQEDVDEDDLNLGTDNSTDHAAPSATVTADPCTEGPEGGQIAVGAGCPSGRCSDQDLPPAGGHSSQHLHTAPRQDAQEVFPCTLETELQHYRETERGISVTVLDVGGQVLDETRIFAPTHLRQHLLEHIAARAFAAYPIYGFTAMWPGGRTIPLGTLLDPHTAQNIILQLYHADEGGSSWQWRIVEIQVGGRSAYTVEVNIHQHVNGGGEQSEPDWDTSPHGSRGEQSSSEPDWDTSPHGSRGDEKEKPKEDGDKGYLCAICMDDDNGDSVVETSCKHCFHHRCLQRWLENQNKCPICRTEKPRIQKREP